SGWPMVADVTETFYVKPESGRLLVSPADATPVPPGDARPEDIDVAVAIDRVHAATTLQIRHVQRAWAGLRSAVADDTPVIGPAPGAAGFIWLAGLSGYGIQTAPAAGALAAALATGTQPRLAGRAVDYGMFRADPALVEDMSDRHPERPAVWHAGQTLSYRRLDRLGNGLAAAAAGRGTVKGNRVAVLLGNSLELPVAYLALMK